LLAKYFLDMQLVMQDMHRLLKASGSAFIVIGNNSTTAGQQPVAIETAQLLADLAAQEQFVVEDTIPMEMLVSRDIFRKNTLTSEVVLCLRRR
jgi:site-specific DNA-methyltransferase (cytosine-N4-specific)